ncbi:FAD-dependent oxidoreductase [Microtetraspora sp. NBRC 16547]|uniref:NAD(P)/FAD-dependent oxidoreductase n=1 Tax=Microtetraspora sp. NBRC 16547 TaxID=3030993 RepID=UPI0024A3F57E|nr:FAD-dependent oxidoreductase [Microtetraspora sp. NBRC 16547]GLW99357.1 oxidoreductase [Microtetraspora sp. NBRC 16547]
MTGDVVANDVVVVGAGHGGTQVATALRRLGWVGRLTLVDADPWMPYQRPPLSKELLGDAKDLAALAFHPPEHYDDSSIDLRLGDAVVKIDRTDRHVVLESGDRLEYDHLVLALGSRPRELPFPTHGLSGIHTLHDAHDAEALRGSLGSARSALIVGAGFIGLELASVLRHHGVKVTVVEVAADILSAALTAETATFLRRRHEADGVNFRFGSSVRLVKGAHGSVRSVVLDSEEEIPCDVVVVGIGTLANDDLAASASIVVDNGIVVDTTFRTSDPRVSAIGDCVRFPGPRGLLRVTSVQNAFDAATHVARRLAGRDAGPVPVPWFWTDQAGVKVQMAGFPGGHDRIEVLGYPDEERFSVRRYREDRLVGGEAVGWPKEHLAVRREMARILG